MLVQVQVTDNQKYVTGVHEAYSQYDTPPAHEHDGNGGASSAQGNSGSGNPSSGDDDDDDAQVNSDLLGTWTKRLQVITAVTTFLAAMDGEMFSLTALNTQIALPMSTKYRQIVYSCLAGALIFHICASILGFISSFALTRHRIVEDSAKVRVIQSSASGLDAGLDASQPAQCPSRKIVLEVVLLPRWLVFFLRLPRRLRFPSGSGSTRSSLPAPMSTLTHCYYTTLCFAAAGFILALTGILTYIWAGLPMPVGIFSTICLGVAISAIVWAIAL